MKTYSFILRVSFILCIGNILTHAQGFSIIQNNGNVYEIDSPNWETEEIIEVTEYDPGYFHVKTTLKTREEIIEQGEDRIEVKGNRVGMISQSGNSPGELLLQYPLKTKSSWKQGDGRKTEYSVIRFVDLTVEAGEFHDVCKIKKTVKALKMESYIYLAPNVGLIKEELINKDKSITTLRELTKFEQTPDTSIQNEKRVNLHFTFIPLKRSRGMTDYFPLKVGNQWTYRMPSISEVIDRQAIIGKYKESEENNREKGTINLNARQIDFMERLTYSLQQHHNEGASFLVFLALGGYNEDPRKIQRKGDAGMADRTVLPAIMKEFRKQYAEQKFTNYRAKALNDIFLSLTEEECSDLINMSDAEITSLANKYADYYAREGREFQQLPKY